MSTAGPRRLGGYEIVSELGRGGMAVVYLARQENLGRPVAIKQLWTHYAGDVEFAARFLRESRMAGSLAHPNIVMVYDYFEDGGAPCIAMEYVSRGSLRPHTRHLTLAQTFGVVEGILAGLAHAHARGIVHRDLKPENIMVTDEGRVKIADFGIAKATASVGGEAFVTATGATIGTPSYMAPEQAMGADVGPPTDLYALGIIVYEQLVGRVPFRDEAPTAILLRHVTEPIPPAADVEPTVDGELSDWIDRLLVKDPAARTASATEAWESLEEIVVRLLGPMWRRDARLQTQEAGAAPPRPLTPAQFEQPDVDETPTVVASDATATAATAQPGAPAQATRRPPRSRWIAVAAVALVAGVIAAIVLTGGDAGDGTTVARTATAPTSTTATVRRAGRFTIGPPIRVGRGPNAIATGAAGVWATSGPDGTVTQVDPRHRRITARVGEAASGVATGAGGVWVTNREAGTVTLLDRLTGRPKGAPIKVGTTANNIVVGGGAVWITCADDDHVARVDPRTQKVTTTIPVADHPVGVAVGRGSVWVTNKRADSVTRISLRRAKVLTTIVVGEDPTLVAVGDGGVWITNFADDTVSRIDPARGAVDRRTIRVGDGPTGIVIDASGVWVANSRAGTLSLIDPETRRQRRLDIGSQPLNLAADEDGVWVTLNGQVRHVTFDRG